MPLNLITKLNVFNTQEFERQFIIFALAKDVGQLVITNVFNTQELHSSCLAFLTHINTDSYMSEDHLYTVYYCMSLYVVLCTKYTNKICLNQPIFRIPFKKCVS